MTFLRFSGNEAAALSATEKSSVEIFFQTLAFRLGLSHHHFLTFVKKFLCDNRFVLAFVYLTVVAHEAGVNRILRIC